MSEEKEFHGLFSQELHELRKENTHLKANNADLVKRNAMLRERPDLPVDRIPQTERYEAEIKSLESRLKEAERKHQCSEHHVKMQENANDELSQRLSQAEALNEKLYSERTPDLKADKIGILEQRLSQAEAENATLKEGKNPQNWPSMIGRLQSELHRYKHLDTEHERAKVHYGELVKSLEQKIAEGENARENSSKWRDKAIDKAVELEARLSKAEADVEKARQQHFFEVLHEHVTERDDIGANFDPSCTWCVAHKTANDLRKRLSQAESELNYAEEIKNIALKEHTKIEVRLSHLMDVAGKMAQLIEHAFENDWKHFPESQEYEHKKAKSLIAEWDGIKNVQ